MDEQTRIPDGMLLANCSAYKSKIKDTVFALQQVSVSLEDLAIGDIELPYRDDLLAILLDISSTDTSIPLYELVKVAMSLFNHERVRDLIFTHGFWSFTNEEVTNLLREAIVEGNLDMVRLVLWFNPNLEARRRRDMTALWLALIFEHEQVAKELILAGVNVNAVWELQGTICGETPIHFAISSDFSDELIDLLIDRGANINATSKRFLTPLVYAVKSCRLYVIQRLISCGARVDIKSKRGCTLLHFACENKRADEILPILLQYNIDVNAVDVVGLNALHYLIRENPSNIAAGNLLLERGASLVCKRHWGWTPLQEVLRRNEEQMVFFCLTYFAKFIAIEKRFCDEDRDFLREYDPLYKTYFEECLKEFERMTEIEIYNGIKFSCLFSKSVGELMDLGKNGDFLTAYVKFNVRQLFPTLYPHVENIVVFITRNCEISK